MMVSGKGNGLITLTGKTYTGHTTLTAGSCAVLTGNAV